MTLIVLMKDDEKIVRFSDSRVSRNIDGKVKKTTDKFSKIMLLPIYATAGDIEKDDLTIFRGEIGFAFCGDVLFATALYTMSSNMFLNLHNVNGSKPPSLKQLAESVANLANVLLDDYILHAKERNYQVALFGCCPATQVLGSYLVEIDEATVPMRYCAKENPFTDGHPLALGSGADYFYGQALHNFKALGRVEVPQIVLKIIHNAVDPTVGGALQVCIADNNRISILPVAQPVNEYMNLNYFVSGVSARDLPDVGEYRIGRTVIGYDNEIVLENQWLQSIGFGKNREENPESANEQARIMRSIQLSQQMKKPMAGIHSYIKVHPPVTPIFGKYYFFARCEVCKKPVKIMEDATNGGNPEPFFGKGGFEGECPNCSRKVQVAAKGLRSKRDKP